MKLKKFYSLFLILTALLCSGNAWGEDKTLTVMNGDYQIQYVPFDGWSLDGAAQHNQFLLLSSELTAMDGGTIKELKFYFDKTGHSWSSTTNIPDVTFRLAEVENTSLSSQVTVDDSFTQVYSGAINLDFTNKLFTVTFDDAYSYNGGNLLIDIQTGTGAYVKKSGNSYLRFYTTNITGRAMKGSTTYSYCPKTTFTYEEASAGSCAKPTAVTATQNTPVKATLSWTKAEGKDNYQYLYVTKGTDPDWTGVTAQNTNSVGLDGLTAGTEYDFYVRTYCSGDDQSDAVKKTFSTSCPAPTAPQVTNIATTTATLSWTAAAGISDYQYIVVERGAAEDWTSPTLVEGAVTTPLSGLTAGTKYDVYVRSYYNATTVSASVKGQFQTPCNAMSIADFNGTFESETAGSGLMPNCWEAAASYDYSDYYSSTTTTYPCVKETYSSNTGNKCLAFYGGTNTTKNIALLPVFTEALNTLTVSFYYKNGSTYGGYISFGYYKNGTFTAFAGTSNLTRTTSYTQVELAIPEVPEGARLAIQYAGGSYSYDAYIDDVTVTLTPSCTKPSGVTVSNIVYNGATVDWTENGSAEAWKVQYSTDNTNWETENVTAHPYDLRGLTTGTPYYVQVISVCGGSDESPAVAAASTFTPTCVKPGTPTIPAKTTTTATIQWTVNSGEDEWYLQYKKASDAEWSDAIHVTTNPTYTLTGLEEGTTYRVHVTAGCKEDYTAAAEFDTECEAKGLPYNWGFDALNCWTMENCVSGTGLSGNTFMFKYGYANQYLISPELDTDDKQVTVEFDYHKATSGTETFMVGYSTTTNAVSAFTFGDVITATNTSDLKYSEILPAGAKYIAIAYTSYDQYYFYVDNFSVSEYVAPSCVAPTALAVSEIGTNSAKVTWNSEATEFALEYKKTSDEDWTAATGDITSPFTLSGLTANETEYSVRVQAICGGTPSEWVVLANPFKTECVTPTVTELAAWNENFESQASDKKPTCWSEVSSYAISAYTQVNASAAKDGSLGVQVYVYGTNTEIALLPTFTEEIKNLKISFDYKNYNTGSNYAALEVGYYNGGEFTNVTTLDKTDVFAASGEIVMPNDAPEGARIAFRVAGKKSGYNGSAYIDNLTVSRKPACAVPTALAAVATSTGATLTWTAGDEETQWNVRYSVKDADTWTVLENKTSGFAITGLEVGTTYEVQVQAYCDENHQSAWTASADFTPVCGAAPTALTVSARSTNAATLTWEGAEEAFKLQTSLDGETWEGAVDVNAKTYELTSLTAGTTYYARVQNACGGEYATTSFTTWCDAKDAAELPLNIESFTAVPECWEINFEGEYSGISNNKIFFYGAAAQMAVLPAYDIELNKLSVTFGFSTNSASLEFGYLDEPNGAFHAFASQPATGVELNLENEAAAVKYIAIRYSSTSAYASGSISSVLVRKTPTCAKPVDVTATPAVGAATIDWTSEAAAWNFQYKLASAADWTEIAVSEKPYPLSGLEQGVSYKVRVQGACAGDDLSDWSEVVAFTTNCDAIDALPFIETFDAALSKCWNITDDETSYYAHSVYGGALNLPGGKAASGHLVVLPEITASLTNAVLTIEYTASTGANTAIPQVGYIDGEFQELVALEKSNTATEARVSLATADGHRLALRYDDGTSEGTFAIREIRILDQLILADNADNTALLSANLNKTVDVTLGRTIFCDGDYNTICLPFDLSEEQLAASPLAGATFKAFKYAVIEPEELQVRVIDVEGGLQAGVPYLLKMTADENLVNPLFKNVTIGATAAQAIGQDQPVEFIGSFAPVAFVGEDQSTLFVHTNNTLTWSAANSNLKAFRAYFHRTSNPSAAPLRPGMAARIVEHEEMTTGVESVQPSAISSQKVLENGQLFIIKNGVKYTIQGQVIEK